MIAKIQDISSALKEIFSTSVNSNNVNSITHFLLTKHTQTLSDQIYHRL